MMRQISSILAIALLCLQLSVPTLAQEAGDIEAQQQQHRELVLSNNCYCKSCTNTVLNTLTAEGDYSCKQRMAWLIGDQGYSEYDACSQVAGVEFPDECGACNPDTCPMGSVSVAVCTKRVVQMCGCHRFNNGKTNCFRVQAKRLCNIPVQKRPAYMDRLLANVQNRCSRRL